MTTEAEPARRIIRFDERFWLVVVLVGFALLQLARVGPDLELGNGTYYLRDAIAFSEGDVARSRYSPGLPILLVPVLWATGGDPAAATVAIEVLTVGVAVAALALTYRVVRLRATAWASLGVTAAFALGQAGLGFLRGINPEPVVLAFVALVLLADDRRGMWAAAITGAAVAVRIAVAPFFGILWLLRLRRRPRVAIVALVLILGAAAAHFATGPVADPSYVEIAESIYDANAATAGPVASVARQIGSGIVTFGRYGVPRLVWPYRVLATPLGPALAAATLAAMAWGLLGRSRPFRWDVVSGTAVYLLLLLAWPIRVTESVRLVVPVAPVLLGGLAVAFDRLGGLAADRVRSAATKRRVVYGILATMAAVALAAGLSGFVQSIGPSTKELDFYQAHRDAAGRVETEPVISRKPAVTELMLGVTAIGYPSGDPTPDDLARYAEGWSACVFVVDGLGRGDEALFAWVDDRTAEVVAEAGATRIVRIDAPWCR